MPIRTNRGRAAVYRKLWGWPMRSPTHLVVLLFVVAVVVIALSVAIPRLIGSSGDGSGAGAGTTEQTTPGDTGAPGTTDERSASGGQGSAGTSLPTRIPSPPQSPSSAPPRPEALEVATKWAQAWVDHPEGTTSEEWLAGLRPYTHEEYLVELATVEPANIPATRVTGPPEPAESYTRSLTVNLPTDAVTLRITLVDTPQGWRVAFYEQAE
jgi:hypothetical protein